MLEIVRYLTNRHLFLTKGDLAKFILVVFENLQVVVVSNFADGALFYAFFDVAARLMGMGAIVEFAFERSLKDFREIMVDLLFVHVNQAKAPDTRGVDNMPAKGQVYHLGEGGAMFAGLVIV